MLNISNADFFGFRQRAAVTNNRWTDYCGNVRDIRDTAANLDPTRRNFARIYRVVIYAMSLYEWKKNKGAAWFCATCFSPIKMAKVGTRSLLRRNTTVPLEFTLRPSHRLYRGERTCCNIRSRSVYNAGLFPRAAAIASRITTGFSVVLESRGNSRHVPCQRYRKLHLFISFGLSVTEMSNGISFYGEAGGRLRSLYSRIIAFNRVRSLWTCEVENDWGKCLLEIIRHAPCSWDKFTFATNVMGMCLDESKYVATDIFPRAREYNRRGIIFGSIWQLYQN